MNSNIDSRDHARGPRIAILGLHLEANAFAPPAPREEFEAECWTIGEAVTQQAYKPSHLPLEVTGFYRRMDETGPWIPVPIIIAAAQPSGPMVHAAFEDFLAIVRDGLVKQKPFDAVYICSHGGSKTTEDDDNDGTLALAVREIVGPDMPVVVTHDLHCNMSERTMRATNALIAYKTNPHVDHKETAAKAADFIRLMLGGMRIKKAFVRLPIAAPMVTLLSSSGPYGDLIQMAKDMTEGPILDISVTAGFLLTDVAKCGLSVIVNAAEDQQAANEAALKIAKAAWNGRHGYVRELTTLGDAVEIARRAAEGATLPVFLADISDNPGGGARGNATWVMRALHEADVHGVILAPFTEPELAMEAHRVGLGNTFHAIFNREEAGFAKRFEAEARVLHLSDGKFLGRRGRDAGREIVLGTSALLELEGSGLRVVVATLREQLSDPRIFEHYGIDISEAKCVVGKSRGHFRAGFDEFFPDERIYEVDTPGLTSSVLTNYLFKGLPRPSWPLDLETTWTAPDAASLAA